jgi:hypothetical protein
VRLQIAQHRLVAEGTPSGDLKDRLRWLKSSRRLNTPDMNAELYAIRDELKVRTKRAGRR